MKIEVEVDEGKVLDALQGSYCGYWSKTMPLWLPHELKFSVVELDRRLRRNAQLA